jgi:hypothetical protein
MFIFTNNEALVSGMKFTIQLSSLSRSFYVTPQSRLVQLERDAQVQ